MSIVINWWCLFGEFLGGVAFGIGLCFVLFIAISICERTWGAEEEEVEQDTD